MSFAKNSLLLLLLLFIIKESSEFVLEGSDVSYAKFRKWSPLTSNNTILLEFNTNQPDGLLLYTDDGGDVDFFELKLVEGSLRLRYNLGEGTQIMNVGRHLNDGLWHRVEIRLGVYDVSLTVDGFVTQSRFNKNDHSFGSFNKNSHVFIGGLPGGYNNRLSDLSLPSVVFEPRFRGAVRNLVYSDEVGTKPQDIIEWKGLVSGSGSEACERHDPCEHGGFCISTDSGPLCDCKHIDFEGAHCEKERSPVEVTFRGGEFIGYDFRESGGEPIVSTLDEISFFFKTKFNQQHDSLLFYSGDGVDYLGISLREGRISMSINLGNGPLDAKIHPDHLRFDDNQWHSIRIHRKIQEMSKTTSLCHITASVDGIHFDRWTLAGSFTLLSSNRVTVGGYDMIKPLPGIKGVGNFIGCLKKVDYRADTLRLSVLELARSGNHLVSVSGRLSLQCHDDNNPDNSLNSFNKPTDNVIKTLSGGGTVTFTTPDAFLTLPKWNMSRAGALSVKIRTTESNGLILFAKGNRQNFLALELIDGHIFAHIETTTHLRIQATTDPIDDGEWHQLKLIKSGRSGTVSVDQIATDFNLKSDKIEVFDNIYVGGVPDINNQHVWTMNLKKGFVGCVRSLVLNDDLIDLAGVAQQQDMGSVRGSCQVGSAGFCVSNPCLNEARCQDGWGRFTCDCLRTNYEGAICQRETPTLILDQFEQQIAMTTSVEAMDITTRFKTYTKNGLLFSITSLSDFLELSIETTRIKLRVRLGDREKILQTGRDINDGNWHFITINRRGNQIKLKLDDIPHVNGEILSRQWVMDVKKIVINSLTNPVNGEMQHFVFNNEDILKSLKFQSPRKFRKNTLILNDVVNFGRNVFIGLPQLRAYFKTDVFLQFKTKVDEGVLFYNGGVSDFICVEFRRGSLVFLLDANSGSNIIEMSLGEFNDNRWHEVSIQVRPNGVKVSVDSIGKEVKVDLNFLNLNGVMYLGGLPENMYSSLPRVIRSRRGYEGCISSLDFGGEYLNPLTDALVNHNSVTSGCSDDSKCTHDSCLNGGVCISDKVCDCQLTSYSGPNCALESISYEFVNGILTFKQEQISNRKSDQIAFGILTGDLDALLIKMDSLLIELVEGRLRLQVEKQSNLFSPGRVNDRSYHVIKVTRFGSNATLQVDKISKSTSVKHSSLSNNNNIVLGGRHNFKLKQIDRAFQGVLSGLVINGNRVLDMATDRDPRVKIIGQTHQINSIGSVLISNELQFMQKTTASLTPGVHDDLIEISSGEKCDDNDDEDCPVGSGVTTSSDDLITPVYVSRPKSTSTSSSIVTYKSKYVCGDDEDCFEVGSGFSTDNDVFVTEDDVTDVTTFGGHTHTSSREPITFSTNDVTTDISQSTHGSSITSITSTTQSHTPPSTTTTTTKSTTTRFIPPHPPSLPPFIPRGRDFDFDMTQFTTPPPQSTNTKETTIYLADTAGDSTLIIIIIIAVLMIIIVSILIIFFMCKRRDDPIYKVAEQQQQIIPPNPVTMGGNLGGGAAGGPRKTGVKEWYV